MKRKKVRFKVEGAEVAVKNKNIKRFLIFLSLVLTIFVIYQIVNIFALFQSKAEGDIESDIAKWKIIINNEDIVSQTVKWFDVDFNIEDAGAAEGKFLPGMKGHFEIVIEPRTTQVSIRYDITIDDTDFRGSDLELFSVMKITEESSVEVETPLVRTGELTYTGIILLEEIKSGYFDKIRITFKWNLPEEEEEEEEHTSPGINGKTILDIPISVKAIQYLGESIDPY